MRTRRNGRPEVVTSSGPWMHYKQLDAALANGSHIGSRWVLVASHLTHLCSILHCLLLLLQARTSTVTKARPASTPRTMMMTDMEKAGETMVGGRT